MLIRISTRPEKKEEKKEEVARKCNYIWDDADSWRYNAIVLDCYNKQRKTLLRQAYIFPLQMNEESKVQ